MGDRSIRDRRNLMCRAMRLMKIYVLLSALGIVAGAACSIKEDRSDCPCRLMLDMSSVRVGSGDSLELTIYSDTSCVCRQKLDSASLREDFVIDVPRRALRLMALCGGEGMTGRDGLVIPLGRSCPRVYTHVSEIDAACEMACDTLKMKKNHCVVSIGFKYGQETEAELAVYGNVCGYDGYGLPLVGEFAAAAVRPQGEEKGLRQVVLPRQCGGELVLRVTGVDGNPRNFRLSDYISAVGYDWTAPDLEDIKITIDMVHTTVSLSVSGWDEEFFFDVVI